MKFTSLILLLFFSNLCKSQMVGPHVYFKGDYIELGINGIGCYEGIEVSTAPVPIGFHQRPVNPYFAMVANPQMNSWLGSSYDGDFITNGNAENGWGFEAINSVGDSVVPWSNCAAPSYEIPGAIVSSSFTPINFSVDWEGNYAQSAYDIDFHINISLNKDALFYTTTVYITNNSDSIIPQFYYYRTLEPDNNQVITGDAITTNQILSQPSSITDRAQVSAKQSVPWNSVISFMGNSPNFRVAKGGYFNRDGSAIWNGTGVLDTSTGSLSTTDEAIALSYRILNFAPGATESFHFFTIFADSLLDGNFDACDLVYNGAGNIIENDTLGDSVYACGSLEMALVGYGVDFYDWTWTPNTFLNTDTGIVVTCSALDTVTYTVTGTPLGFGISQILTVTVIPSSEPIISFVSPGPQCNSFDLNTLVFADSTGISSISTFHNEIPENANDMSNLFTSFIITPADTFYLMMANSLTGCYDLEQLPIIWQDVLFDLNTTTTSCISNTGTATVSDISASPGTYTISWITGDTTTTVNSQPWGPISVTITGPGSCITYANAIIYENIFTFFIDGYAAGCGNSNGSAVPLITGDPFNTYSYLWNTGETDSILTDVDSGFYSVTIVNQDGCDYSNSIVIPNITTTFSLTNGVLDASCLTCANGSIYTFLSGSPIMPVTYVWSNGASTPNVFALLPGTYTVTATDSIGCTFTDTFYVGYPFEITQLESDFKISIFPNPVNEKVSIQSTQIINKVILYSLDGRILLERPINSLAVEINLDQFATGVYHMSVIIDNKPSYFKLIKN